MHNSTLPPVVLIIAGNDPSGGAGLAADMQAVTALGAHPAPVISAITVQDTVNATRVEAIQPQLIVQQAETVLADLPVAAIKLGLIVNSAAAQAVAQILKAHTETPVVLDPVLIAGGGAVLAEEALISVYLETLLPLAAIVTPNAYESRRLAPEGADAKSRAAALLAHGCQHVLIKGADENTADVQNILFSRDGTQKGFSWPRLPGKYHGSGCTLASAIAALLARGYAPLEAVEQAQRYTWETLKQGWRLGKGQAIP
ncbi:MAG: bifunctional hydroxymethylpyrimidine kinase/phosphomethylpyrimidine kinase, partial [Gammaproteobacteria bacterium]